MSFPWLAVLLLLLITARTVQLRRRVRQLAVLATGGSTARAAGYSVVTAEGVRVPPEVVRRAAGHADREGLRAVDLVPEGLAAEAVMDLFQQVDPVAYRDDPLTIAVSTGHALLVEDALVERAAVSETRDLNPAQMMRVTARLKQYAPQECGLVVAPGLAAMPPDPTKRKACVRALGVPSAVGLVGPGLLFWAMLAALVFTPVWGVAVLGLYWVQPYLVFAGRPPLRPGNLHQAALLRPVLAPWRWARAATGRWSDPTARDSGAELDRLRAEYAGAIAEGLDRFFEPRREDCPWCGSGRLFVRVRLRDLLQGKPGRFVLEQCRDCEHVFQNPRLSPAGLDYYYRDFYDGLNTDDTEVTFASMRSQYEGRVAMLQPHASPKAWLDVGTGHAHFCLFARSVVPEAEFDGLDMSDSILEAQRRGWIGRAHHGQFPELAGELAGCYDVVSMFHYLEHSRDPFAELDAAASVLIPGGHLLIEVPRPESRLGRVLRSRWLPWFPPQHQHLIPAANLRAALAERGLEVIAEEVGPAHQGGDFSGSVSQTVVWLGPDPDRPWAGPPTPVRRWRRIGVVALSVPFFVCSLLLDALGHLVCRLANGGNAYRMLARKTIDETP